MYLKVKYLLLALLSFTVQAKQIHIAIVDSGYPRFKTDAKICKNGLITIAGDDIYDNLEHGSNIEGIIADRLKGIDYCLYIIKVYDKKPESKSFDTLKAFMIAYYLPDLDIINYSSSGPNSDYLEEVLLMGLIAKGVKIVVAAGNNHANLDNDCDSFPACYKGIISVGNGISNADHNSTSNYGKKVTAWRPGNHVCANGYCMNGTSQSTAIYTSDLAKKLAHEN